MGREVGGRFMRQGTYVYLWLMVSAIEVWQKPSQYCKVNCPPIKNKTNGVHTFIQLCSPGLMLHFK